MAEEAEMIHWKTRYILAHTESMHKEKYSSLAVDSANEFKVKRA